MAAGLDNLLGWAGASSGAPAAVAQLGSALLQSAVGTAPCRHSTLNNDGSPLQVCATYGPHGRKLRLIGDPEAGQANPRLRLLTARRALAQTLALNDASLLAELCDLSLQRLLPPVAGPGTLEAGSIWIAAGIGGGAAMYVNARWGDTAERWRDAGRWLDAILPHAAAAQAAVAAIRPHGTLASFALEGSTPSDARAKLYWRLDRPLTLAALGLPLLDHDDCRAFLHAAVGERALPLTGLVLSAGFGLADGRLSDVKLDLCAHCLPRTPRAWVRTLDACRHRFALAPLDIAEAILARHGELAFVGFGLDRTGGRRLNVYLKPGVDREQVESPRNVNPLDNKACVSVSRSQVIGKRSSGTRH